MSGAASKLSLRYSWGRVEQSRHEQVIPGWGTHMGGVHTWVGYTHDRPRAVEIGVGKVGKSRVE